jgi:large subunit ribosomal protein L22
MKASLRNTRISPKKMNLIAELVRGSSAQEAVVFLNYTPKKGAKILKKVIASAVANASNNFKQDSESLYVKEIKVSKAFTIKRFIAGSRGRARPILKRASHVHVELEARPTVAKKVKAVKKTAKSTPKAKTDSKSKSKTTTKK